MSQWIDLRYQDNVTYGKRVFINMPWRAQVERSNRLMAWVSPIMGHEDNPGAWLFHATSGRNDMPEMQATELLAGLFTYLAGHGFTPEKLTFTMLAALAQRPQHHIPNAQREAAKRHIARQKEGVLTRGQNQNLVQEIG